MLLFSWYLSLSKIVLFTYLFSVFLSKRHENKNLQSLCLAQSKEIKRKKKKLTKLFNKLWKVEEIVSVEKACE